MTYRSLNSGMARNQGLWPLLLLLIIAVVVPTACVLWFMTEAMRNERLAVRQKLISFYESQLDAAEERLKTYFDDKRTALASVDADASASQIFASLVLADVADSVIVYNASGSARYPFNRGIEPPRHGPEPIDWLSARELEFEGADPATAAKIYARLARESTDINMRGRALQAQVRCLLKSGDQQAAMRLLDEELSQEVYRNAIDEHGRVIALYTRLLALQIMSETDDADFQRIFQELKSRLVDYGSSTLSSDQRRFLMKQLQLLRPESVGFPTLAAEELAERYLEADLPAIRHSTLHPSELPDIWQLPSPDGRVLALFKHQDLMENAQALIASQDPSADSSVELVQPGAEPTRSSFLLSPPSRGVLEGWRLSLYFKDGQNERLFDAAADEQIAAYMWTGILVIAVIVTLTILAGGVIQRQARLTRLKNDLVATVSHELKTPLASMRLLVDTLLDDERFDERKVRDYLQLISKENTRLSHLIDNFLTFSRMQRNKRAFTFVDTDAAEITNTAVEAVGEKFNSARCQLEVETTADLPRIVADTDALVTVIVNLLDNAYKYTEDEKRIKLRTYANGDHVYFDVQDNGIGLSRRAAKRVFERFYQADQHLSRAASGCGLGLSIVQFIVAAHGGTVSVDSEPGQGSLFRVRIPVAVSRSAKTFGAAG